MGIFDVHTHLTHPHLAAQVEAVLERAARAGLTSIISNGLNPADNQAVLDLSQRFGIVKPALGLYPVDAVLQAMRVAGHSYPDQRQSWAPGEAVQWVRERADQAFAIGEIGLDGYWVPEPFWEAQERVFRELVTIALEADKAIIIHTRKREPRTFEVLRELGVRRVNWHCFGGRLKLAREIADYGHYLSIPANVERAQSFAKMVQSLPRDRLLLETDAPYLGPERDVFNEPANVQRTVQYMAKAWGLHEAQVIEQLCSNFYQLFGVAP